MLSLPGKHTPPLIDGHGQGDSHLSDEPGYHQESDQVEEELSQKQCPGLGLSGLYRSEYEGYQQAGVAQRMEERGQEPGQPPQLPVP